MNKKLVDKMSRDYLIHSLQSIALLELTVRFNVKGIFSVVSVHSATVVNESLLTESLTTLLEFGECCFFHAGPKAWNSMQ